ncbi:hypothetical protein MMC13_001347 [Lambiella insularis]|nr:hypothetical protein [Lambiella insularis]
MPELPQKVLSWLYNVLGTNEYHDVNRTYTDTRQVLSSTSTLRPRTDIYTFENGRSSLLLHITGTLPVLFRGTTYSFPISLWVPHVYPSEGPIVYVTPTREMVVRPGQYVSGEGRIYHPYLANWRADRSNLTEFTRILQDVFAQEPPVMSKREDIAKPPPPAPKFGGPPPLPPLPPELGRSSPTADQSRSQPLSSGQPPPPPPKPFESHTGLINAYQGGAPPVPSHPGRLPQARRPDSDHFSNGYPQSSQPYSPSGQYIPQRVNSLRSDEYRPATSDQRGGPPSSYERRDSAYPKNLPSEATAHSPGQYSPAQQRYQSQPVPSLPNPSLVPNSWESQPQKLPHQSLNPVRQSTYPGPSQVQPRPKPPEDLLTSPFDTPLPSQPSTAHIPAPPIPPNPEKDALLAAASRTLTQHLHSALASNAAFIPPLRAQNSALQATVQRLQQEQQALTSLDALLTSNEAILHKAMRDADECIQNAKHRTVPAVDEVLVAPTVVGEQLYELVAEEKACVDARGMLGRALDKGRVGSEDWVKRARGMAREEFLKRVIIKKCAKGLGLRTEEEWG